MSQHLRINYLQTRTFLFNQFYSTQLMGLGYLQIIFSFAQTMCPSCLTCGVRASLPAKYNYLSASKLTKYLFYANKNFPLHICFYKIVWGPTQIFVPLFEKTQFCAEKILCLTPLVPHMTIISCSLLRSWNKQWHKLLSIQHWSFLYTVLWAY